MIDKQSLDGCLWTSWGYESRFDISRINPALFLLALCVTSLLWRQRYQTTWSARASLPQTKRVHFSMLSPVLHPRTNKPMPIWTESATLSVTQKMFKPITALGTCFQESLLVAPSPMRLAWANALAFRNQRFAHVSGVAVNRQGRD